LIINRLNFHQEGNQKKLLLPHNKSQLPFPRNLNNNRRKEKGQKKSQWQRRIHTCMQEKKGKKKENQKPVKVRNTALTRAIQMQTIRTRKETPK
jgi:hypothetical protein